MKRNARICIITQSNNGMEKKYVTIKKNPPIFVRINFTSFLIEKKKCICEKNRGKTLIFAVKYLQTF